VTEREKTKATRPGVPFALHSISVEFGGERVLDGVDLTIHRGDYVALLGENGSGKSTLLRAMLGLVPLSSGSIEVHGRRLGRAPADVAYVPQQLLGATAVPVSVAETVRAALISPRRRWRLSARQAHERSEQALAAVGLLHRAADRLDTLSGGQQRRVMVARALAMGTTTLLLDEPTAGVDADSESRLADVLAELHDSGHTIVLVTHELGEVTRAANRAVVLGGRPSGRVRYDGAVPPPAHIYAGTWHHHDAEPMPDEPGGVLPG
jgi:zinc transport system ATP-binding protein